MARNVPLKRQDQSPSFAATGAKSLAIYPETAKTLQSVCVVEGAIKETNVMIHLSVQTALVLILHILLLAQHLQPTMLILQNDLTLANTSIPLLKQCLKLDQPHVVLLQEIWHPEIELKFHGYSQRPIVLERKDKKNGARVLDKEKTAGGGVAIITRKDVRCRQIKDLSVPDLEAVWAEVKFKEKKMLVGSVYIPPSDTRALKVFIKLLSKICGKYNKIVIGMDANSRNPLWDNSTIGRKTGTSYTMGEHLVDAIQENDMCIHNSGVPTFIQSGNATAPDVTLSKGISVFGNIKWSTSRRSLGTNHETIFLQIGQEKSEGLKTVVDWPNFDWDAYEDETKQQFTSLLNSLATSNPDPKTMSSQLVQTLTECVEEVATTRTISKHSKPWMSKEIIK